MGWCAPGNPGNLPFSLSVPAAIGGLVGVTRAGPAARAAGRTIRALTSTGTLDPSRDAAAIERLKGLAALIDESREARTLECPHCEGPVPSGTDSVAAIRASRELRSWWEAIRETRREVQQGVTIADLFADLDLDDLDDLAGPTR